jgi:Tol biopolymer transport system component
VARCIRWKRPTPGRTRGYHGIHVPWAYSRDGTRIAYTGYERGDAGDYAIYVSNADGTDVTDLTSTYLDPAESSQGGPVWSPDGTLIAFSNYSNDPSTQGVYLMNADGTGIHKIADGGSPSWSPDGESIVFAAAAEKGNDIYSVSIDGSRLTRLTHTSAVEAFPTWSPDGSQIAYIEYTDGEELWVMDADGSHAHAVTASRTTAWVDSPPTGRRTGRRSRSRSSSAEAGTFTPSTPTGRTSGRLPTAPAMRFSPCGHPTVRLSRTWRARTVRSGTKQEPSISTRLVQTEPSGRRLRQTQEAQAAHWPGSRFRTRFRRQRPERRQAISAT